LFYRHGDERDMPPFVPYLIGLVTAPLVVKVVKPLLRGTVKTTIEVGLQVKKLAAEAAEDLQDLAAEASAEMAAAEMTAGKTGTRSGVAVVEPGVSVTGHQKR
jgi:Protein of unknown function (DUF5132)